MSWGINKLLEAKCLEQNLAIVWIQWALDIMSSEYDMASTVGKEQKRKKLG